MDPADARDVESSLSGDGDAYGRLVRRHQEAIALQMHRFTRDRGTLEELVQDVFVEAYGSLATWQRRAPFLHWLRRIAVRVGYRHWRSRARTPDPLIDSHTRALTAPPGDLEARDAADWVHAMLARLPPRDRLVLTLLALEERPVAEVAELTGFSRALVKVAAFRARRKLRRMLEEDTP